MAKSDSDSGSLWQDQPELPTQKVGLDRLQSKTFLKRSSQASYPTKSNWYTALHSQSSECRNYYMIESLLHHIKNMTLILVLSDYHPFSLLSG